MTPKYLFLILTLFYVTQYGWTGNKMANGQYPYVGAIACPRNIPFNTQITIMGESYTCTDRTARRYDGRFDIYSTRTREEMIKWGKRKLNVEILPVTISKL